MNEAFRFMRYSRFLVPGSDSFRDPRELHPLVRIICSGLSFRLTNQYVRRSTSNQCHQLTGIIIYACLRMNVCVCISACKESGQPTQLKHGSHVDAGADDKAKLRSLSLFAYSIHAESDGQTKPDQTVNVFCCCFSARQFRLFEKKWLGLRTNQLQ